MKKATKNDRRFKRGLRSAAMNQGSATVPRVVVFRSNHYTYVQAVDDSGSRTLAGMSSRSIDGGKGEKSDLALKLGKQFGEKLKELSISQIKFDRNGYRYHGRVANVAKGLREGDIIF
jgi:large subunit ribosomal protein L18